MARLVRNDTPDGIECLKSKTFGHLEVLWYSEFIKRGKSYVHWWAVECEKCGKRFRQTTEQLLGDVLELSFCRSCPVQELKQINRYAKIQNLGRKKLAKKPLKNRSPASLRTKKPQLPKGARDLLGKRFGNNHSSQKISLYQFIELMTSCFFLYEEHNERMYNNFR